MRVLVVEDDVLVRAFAVAVLEEEGFDVLEAETGEEGLERCHDDQPDVLFTDIRLPGQVNGWDIAELCRQRHPDLPVIYATGFSDVSARPVPGSVLFQKPYRAEQLVSTIRGLMAA